MVTFIVGEHCFRNKGGGWWLLSSILVEDENERLMELGGQSGWQGFAFSEVHPTFGLESSAPHACSTGAMARVAEVVVFEDEATTGVAMAKLDVGGKPWMDIPSMVKQTLWMWACTPAE